MDGQKTAPCIFCTSAILGGRMPRCRDAKSGIGIPLRRISLRLFLAALGLFVCATARPACLPGPEAETAGVKYVHDGDTAILANGRKLRFIGVDTPELEDEHKPAEPLAVEARDFVRQLLRRYGNKVELDYDQELTDVYHRQLAHVFLPDDRSLSEILLKNGLATTLVVPPNTRYSDCYALAEKNARRHHKGLWALPRYRAITAAQLSPATIGFRVVRGDVLRVSHRQRADYIYVGEPKSDKMLRVKIAREDRQYFDDMPLKPLTGKTIEIRSRIYETEGRFFARIRYPTALQVLPH
jgi:endonuclease YncB( thermonuclease family)